MINFIKSGMDLLDAENNFKVMIKSLYIFMFSGVAAFTAYGIFLVIKESRGNDVLDCKSYEFII